MSYEYIEIGEGIKVIKISVRQSSRVKHTILKVTTIGEVELVVPKRFNFVKAKEFALSKESWIRDKLSKHSPSLPMPNNEIPIFGDILKIIYVQSPIEKIVINGDRLLICDKLIHLVHIDLKYFLRAKLKSYISDKIQQMSIALNVKYEKVIIKDTKSRWGSCSNTGVIYFSWRLIFAPLEVIDYVIAHEASHLIEMNHSKNFWKTVYKIYPKYKIAKFWLKKNGIKLFQYLPSN